MMFIKTIQNHFSENYDPIDFNELPNQIVKISTEDWYYRVDGSKWFMSKFAANRNYCEMTNYADRTKVLGMRITEIEQFFTTEKPKLYKDSDFVPNSK